MYSTQPLRAEGDDHNSYFVKGPAREIVIAEVLGCLMARAVAIPVPEVAICRNGPDDYAGSLTVPSAFRDVMPYLKDRERILNYNDLWRTLVVDVWLANKDRNPGNVLGRPEGNGKIQLVMIDFEKSAVLRPYPIVSSPELTERQLWPSGELGALLKGRKPLVPPPDICERIRAIDRQRCSQIIASVTEVIGDFDYSENTIKALVGRGEKIESLARGVWERN